jgi:hypothetical protein
MMMTPRSFKSLALVALVAAGCGRIDPDRSSFYVDTTSGAICTAMPRGAVTACAYDPVSGEPSQRGYMTVTEAGSPTLYICATDWSPERGFSFEHPDQYLDNWEQCCAPGGAPCPDMLPGPPDMGPPPSPDFGAPPWSPPDFGVPPAPDFGPTYPWVPPGGYDLAPPAAPAPSVSLHTLAEPAGYLGKPHGPTQVKPQEFTNGKDGAIRKNPFGVTVTDAASAQAAATQMATWMSRAGDGKQHAAADGGKYTFPKPLIINYVIMQDKNGRTVIVVGPEVSLDPGGTKLLGHPTLGACQSDGGVPKCLIAGELVGNPNMLTINNNSGRYGYDPSVTAGALDNAAALFKSYGMMITTVDYRAPKK